MHHKHRLAVGQVVGFQTVIVLQKECADLHMASAQRFSKLYLSFVVAVAFTPTKSSVCTHAATSALFARCLYPVLFMTLSALCQCHLIQWTSATRRPAQMCPAVWPYPTRLGPDIFSFDCKPDKNSL